MTTLVATPTSRGTLWLGDWGPYSGAQGKNQYPTLIAETPTRLQILTDTPPPGLAQYARLTVLDGDLSGQTNPRCQPQSPNIGHEGQTLRFSGWIRMNYIPVVGAGQFFLVMEIFGPPFFASPQIQLVIDGSGNLCLENYSLGAPYYIWRTPIPAPVNGVGTWMHFAITTKLSVDPAQGWIELAFAQDGTDKDVAQTLTWGGTNYSQFFMQTLNVNTSTGAKGNQTPIYPDLYRSRGLEASSTVDHAGYRVDTIS